MNFVGIIEQILLEREEEVSEFPMEVRANGYVGTISKNKRKKVYPSGKTVYYDTFRPYIGSGRQGVSVSVTPTGKSIIGPGLRKLEDAIEYLKKKFNSWPALKDTEYPKDLEKVEIPFTIIKGGKIVATVKKHAHPKSQEKFSYDIVKYEEKIPGRVRSYIKTVKDLKQALDIAFYVTPGTYAPDTQYPTREEVLRDKKVKVVKNNRTGMLKHEFTKGGVEYFKAKVYGTILSNRESVIVRNNFDKALTWLDKMLNDVTIFPSFYPKGIGKKLYLQRIETDENSFKYEVTRVATKDIVANINLKQTFQDNLHNIKLYIGVCAELLFENKRIMNYVSDFLHLMRGKEIRKNNTNTVEEKQSFYLSTVTNTVDIVNKLLTQHPTAKVYFADSTTSRFNADVRERVNVSKESVYIIPKRTFKDLREEYFNSPGKFFKGMLRYPESTKGILIMQALRAFFNSDLDEEVLNEKVSTTEIAKYVKAIWINSQEDPDFRPFGNKKLSITDKTFLNNIAWIMQEIIGPTHATRARIGSQKTIPPSFSVFQRLPKVSTTDRETVIIIDDNLNRFNTYESINANIQQAFNNNVDIIWVLGAGIKERIELYLS